MRPKRCSSRFGFQRQVVVDHQVGALQVDAFASGIGGLQHLHLRVVPENFLHGQTLLAAHAAVDPHARHEIEDCSVIV